MASDNPTLTEKLASAIADGILSGTLKPGLRLDEASLAQQHGVSRTPVREALTRLEAESLVTRRHDGGDGSHMRPPCRPEHDADRAAAPPGSA
jgi:DNA-binding GntR family transcriptional regulator